MLRIEGLADAVFGFALTLLVVSLEVPNTFDELLATMRGFFAFAISGWLLYSVWCDHYIFFRRYGLQDNATMHLSAVLLFVVLFYVYPLSSSSPRSLTSYWALAPRLALRRELSSRRYGQGNGRC